MPVVWFDADDRERELTEFVARKLGVPRARLLDPASSFESLGVDSLDIVELIMELEEAFEINIADEETENLKAIGDVIEFILRRLGRRRTE